jgi:hypothetical protein
MRDRLLIFGGFAHDSQRVLARVEQLAFVGRESVSDGSLSVSPKLRIASFADANQRSGLVHDSQLSLGHEHILPQAASESESREFQTAPLPGGVWAGAALPTRAFAICYHGFAAQRTPSPS